MNQAMQMNTAIALGENKDNPILLEPETKLQFELNQNPSKKEPKMIQQILVEMGFLQMQNDIPFERQG